MEEVPEGNPRVERGFIGVVSTNSSGTDAAISMSLVLRWGTKIIYLLID